MDNFWTSKKPINGLRHFVLVNESKVNSEIFFLFVSVLDAEINLEITFDELMNSGNWEKGWINLPQIESITEDYVEYKSIHKDGITKILIKNDSLFNIS